MPQPKEDVLRNATYSRDTACVLGIQLFPGQTHRTAPRSSDPEVFAPPSIACSRIGWFTCRFVADLVDKYQGHRY